MNDREPLATNMAERLKPGRRIVGQSAILLPFLSSGQVDWDGFGAHVQRTLDAGLAPAVNMDTGFIQLIDLDIRKRVLQITGGLCAGRTFVAGAFVADTPTDALNVAAYRSAIDEIVTTGGTPVIFPSWGLTATTEAEWVDAQASMTTDVAEFIGFELGTMFVPNGRIVSLESYEQLMALPNCIGAKHSSLSRQLEWDRLELRDRIRPDFKVFTGNDLAIDMVMWGSDYLLGLSTFAPDAFAMRDRYWLEGDPAFYQLNDLLQELGAFVFRNPVPAYKHDAAMFLQIRGFIGSDTGPDGAGRRPEGDRDVLVDIARRLEEWV